MTLAADYPLMNVFFTIMYVFLFFMYVFILISVFIDIFRSSDLSGVGKALWLLVVFVFQILGVLIYLIVRGGSMHERSVQAAQAQDAAMKAYIQQAAGTGTAADELTKLVSLRDSGVINDAEFEAQKAKLLS